MASSTLNPDRQGVPKPIKIVTPAPAPVTPRDEDEDEDEQSPEMMELYRQLPLPTGRKCIRAMTIQSPDLSVPDSGPLQGTMPVVDLDDYPDFTALSYVWGERASAHGSIPTVLCGGTPLPITPNCHSALVHLRRRFEKFIIWVDTICIHRSDPHEKLHQIPLMGEIYAEASISYM